MTSADELHRIAVLVYQFVVFSLFSVGGGLSTLLPQIRAEFVEHFRFISDRTFTETLAVAQAVPGPNFLLSALIGVQVAGLPGALAALVAFLALPVTIATYAGRLLQRHQNPFIQRLRRSFRPVTGGLLAATGLVIASTTDRSIAAWCITGAIAAVTLAIDVSPFWWCIAGGIAGAILAVA